MRVRKVREKKSRDFVPVFVRVSNTALGMPVGISTSPFRFRYVYSWGFRVCMVSPSAALRVR